METKKIATKTMVIIFVVTFLIVEVIGLCFGKVIEGNLFAEIAKWVVMGILLGLLVCGISYALVGTYASRKGDGLTKK